MDFSFRQTTRLDIVTSRLRLEAKLTKRGLLGASATLHSLDQKGAE